MHTEACVLVTISQELLRCGLERLCDDFVSSLTSSISLSQLLNFLIRILGAEVSPLRRIKQRLLKEYVVSKRHTAKINFRVSAHSYGSSSLDLQHCRVEKSRNFRRLVAIAGVLPGVKLLQEEPCVVCLKSSCGCCEGTVLVEHIEMSREIFHSRFTNKVKFDFLMRNLCCGIPEEIPTFGDCKDADEQWSLHMVYFLGVVGFLFVLFELPDLVIPSEEFFLHVSDFVKVLSRLPLNVHAVTELFTQDQHGLLVATDHLQSRRLGYSLYLHSSSVNHSCVPNAIVRYPKPTEKYHTQFSGIDNQDILNLLNTNIQIISLTGITKGQEICISYGPVHRKHNFFSRQKILLSQYLFACQCQGCSTERANLMEKERILRSCTPEVREGVKDFSFSVVQIHEDLVQINTGLWCLTLEEKRRILNSCRQLLVQLIKKYLNSGWNIFLAKVEKLIQRFTKFAETIVDKGKFINIREKVEKWKFLPRDFQSNQLSQVDILLLEFLFTYSFFLSLQNQCLVEQGEFSSAVPSIFLQIAMMACQNFYDFESSIELNREISKLATIYFNLGFLNFSYILALKAQSCFKKFLVSDDMDQKEMDHIVNYFENISNR